eukprot:Unigene2604_Nuclearia_a/m.8043 Unigene2604_Nuclearia_a/g.8043  ORF Unigene2604_Nuclearia_a/g.8043 Unigene2604_Nuclearia_a/m.8043 type:complete len:106 (-) Unigene2604_Nuclearia_a:96-413(-)
MLRQMSTHLTSAVEELAHVKNELANQQAQAPTPKTNLQQVREATEQRMASREEVSRLQSRNHKIQDAHEQLQRARLLVLTALGLTRVTGYAQPRRRAAADPCRPR